MPPAFHLLPRLPNPARPAAEYDARAFGHRLNCSRICGGAFFHRSASVATAAAVAAGGDGSVIGPRCGLCGVFGHVRYSSACTLRAQLPTLPRRRRVPDKGPVSVRLRPAGDVAPATALIEQTVPGTRRTCIISASAIWRWRSWPGQGYYCTVVRGVRGAGGASCGTCSAGRWLRRMRRTTRTPTRRTMRMMRRRTPPCGWRRRWPGVAAPRR